MPELPEVETTVRGLARFLDGARITRVTLNRANLRRPFPADLVQMMTGAQVTGLSRRAKYGLIQLDRDATMIFHLGMSGRWRIDPEVPDKHDHLLLETADHRFALCDPRRFGSVDLVGTPMLDAWPAFAALGPEPLGPGLTASHLKTALAGKTQSIKLCLLDQRIVAGLGNIYVCEALWRAGILPTKQAGKVTGAATRPFGACDSRRARSVDPRWRLDLARLRPARWRIGLFRQQLRCLRTNGRSLPPR